MKGLIENSWRPSSENPDSLLRRRTHDRFYDAWEALERGPREEAVRARLNEYIELARGLPFIVNVFRDMTPIPIRHWPRCPC